MPAAAAAAARSTLKLVQVELVGALRIVRQLVPLALMATPSPLAWPVKSNGKALVSSPVWTCEKLSVAAVTPVRFTVQTASFNVSTPLGLRSIISAKALVLPGPSGVLTRTRPPGSEENVVIDAGSTPDSKFSDASTAPSRPTTAPRRADARGVWRLTKEALTSWALARVLLSAP